LYDSGKSLEEKLEGLEREVSKLKQEVGARESEKRRVSEYLEPTERQQLIFKFIEDHPNCTKQGVVDHFKGQFSRKPVYDIIKVLVDEERILDKPDPKNSQIRNLIVNESSLMNSILEELDHLRDNFVHLSHKMFEVAEKEYGSDPDNIKDEYFELVGQPYLILNAIIESYIVRSTMVWPDRIKDKDMLRRLVAIVFVRITNLFLYHIPKIRVEDTIDYHREIYMILKLRGTGYLKSFFEFSKKFGLENEMDPVLDDLWNINKDVQQYAYPEPRLFFWEDFEYKKHDWRKLLELVDKHGGRTITDLEKMPIDGLLNKDKDTDG
jgi:hypothetical protein